jgi:hypothetical protein
MSTQHYKDLKIKVNTKIPATGARIFKKNNKGETIESCSIYIQMH